MQDSSHDMQTAAKLSRPGRTSAPRISNRRYGFDAELRTPKPLRKRIKSWIAALPSSHTLRLLAQWPELRIWKATRIGLDTPVYSDRYALYDALIAERLPERFAYLEFGCAAGEVVRRWAASCPNTECRFWGFDTFTGMPEDWRGLGWRVKRGAWSQGGEPPRSSDPRVAYVKGRFQDSLPGFLEESCVMSRFDHYVLHLDADLYTATLYVLAMMHPVLDRATVIFDEFDCPLDEMKALDDFCRSFCMDYEVLGVAEACEKVAIRFLPKDPS